MPIIYSTMTAGVNYSFYEKRGGDSVVRNHVISIKGGAGLATKHLVTPLGVPTVISDEDYELLKKHPLFKEQQAKGFIKLDDKKEVEAAVADMKLRDGSAPLVPQDIPEDGPQLSDRAPVKVKNDKKRS